VENVSSITITANPNNTFTSSEGPLSVNGISFSGNIASFSFANNANQQAGIISIEAIPNLNVTITNNQGQLIHAQQITQLPFEGFDISEIIDAMEPGTFGPAAPPPGY
jgi:hypothetical protein